MSTISLPCEPHPFLVLTYILSQYSAHEEWKSLSSIASILEPTARSRAEFIEECKSGVFDNVVATYRTFSSVAITGLIDEELVQNLPKGLKYIAHNGMELEVEVEMELG